MPSSVRRLVVWALAFYAALSLFCFVLSFDVVAKALPLRALGFVLWLAGPALTLVLGAEHLMAYVIETVIVGVLAWTCILLTRRSRAAATLAGAILVLVWISCAFLVYAAGF
jgi:hypothetical protein